VKVRNVQKDVFDKVQICTDMKKEKRKEMKKDRRSISSRRATTNTGGHCHIRRSTSGVIHLTVEYPKILT
jgi:hypothetical protein